MPERENKLVLLKTKGALATLASDPRSVIDSAVRINSELYAFFDIEKFLRELNEKLFKGKGKVSPLSHSFSIFPDTKDKGESSRFRRLFSLGYQVNQVSSGAELVVDREKKLYDTKEEALEKAKHGKYFWGLGIKVYQTVGIIDKEFDLNILGKIYFRIKRSSDGNWDGRQDFLSMTSQGRFLGFSCHSIPSIDEFSTILQQNIEEILEELAAHEFIPSLKGFQQL